MQIRGSVRLPREFPPCVHQGGISLKIEGLGVQDGV